MRVVIFSDTMDRTAMGTALYTRKLVEGLLAMRGRHKLELYLAHRKHTGDPLYEAGRELLLPQVSIPKLSRALSEALFLWKYRKVFDIIHYPQESIYPLFWLSRAKIVISVHSHIEGWRTYGLGVRYWMVYVTLRFFAWRLTSVICMSSSVKKSIEHQFPALRGKIFLTPEGVDESFRTPPSKSEAQQLMAERYGIPVPFILVPSRVDPQKNIPRIIDAYAAVRKEGTLSQALVVGARHMSEETSRVEKAIARHRLGKHVFFRPYVEPEDMPALYAAADATVYPSLHEGFGLPILESMAAGTPVVTSSSFSMPEVAGGAAFLVDPTDVSAIASAIRRVLTEPALSLSLCEKGRIHASRYSWSTMVFETVSVYDTMCRVS